MADITISRTITYDFPWWIVSMTLIVIVLIICIFIVWRTCLIERTKQKEIEFELIKASLRTFKELNKESKIPETKLIESESKSHNLTLTITNK